MALVAVVAIIANELESGRKRKIHPWTSTFPGDTRQPSPRPPREAGPREAASTRGRDRR